MQEETLRQTLLGFAALVVLVLVGAGVFLGPMVSAVAEPFLNVVFCPASNTSGYLVAQPTSPDVCKELSSSSSRPDGNLCGYYSADKVDACRQLSDIVDRRALDCLSYSFSDKTDFAQGAPQVNALCQTLKS
ncbi:MAG: hypothetical protein Q8P02_00905 [Candidatus Micrarchaeota archaeon]|nr:hypothetical protein [Candidatus Micrarchaeota archaeon]